MLVHDAADIIDDKLIAVIPARTADRFFGSLMLLCSSASSRRVHMIVETPGHFPPTYPAFAPQKSSI